MFKPYVFLRGLLLLAGDVETNPGPIQSRWNYTHIDSSILVVVVVYSSMLYSILVSRIRTLIELVSIAFWHAHLSSLGVI